MTRFILIADDIAPAQADKVTQYLKDKGFGFWHWVDKVWLLTTRQSATAQSLRNELRGVDEKATFIVLQIEALDWATYSPTTWTEWLQKNWKQY